MSICIFTGPTLRPEEGLNELEAIYLPPVAQGDVFRLASRQPKAIGIIDGYFDQVPAVWHKEILWAMAQGIHVYGSASMGALRAAELAPFGMEGVGAIFNSFRDGVLEDDDEVAVTHGPAEADYCKISDAMVNIRATLAKAEAESVLAPATHAELVRIAKRLFYPDRSYSQLLRLGAEAGLPNLELERLRAWLPDGAIDLKRQDALAMLRLMHLQLSGEVRPKRVGYQMENTDFWHQVMRSDTEPSTDGDGSRRLLPNDVVFEELRLQGGIYLQIRDQGLLRDLALEEAQYFGHGAGSDAVQSYTNQLRQRLGLQEDADFEQWLSDNRLTPERFSVLAKAEAALEKLRWARGASENLLDQLRLTGRYVGLLRRALDKQRLLAAAGLETPTLQTTGLTREALLAWYFDRLGPLYSADLRRHASTFGFESDDSLVDAILREYCYIQLCNRDSG